MDDLDGVDFDCPWDLDTVLSWTVARLERGMVHVSHPRYFGLFNPAPSLASRCADQIVANINPQLASAVTSPFPVAVEARVIREVCRRAGLPAGSSGHFTSSGSEANFTALLCALTRAERGYGVVGARAFSGQPRLYVSRDAHLCWLKIAHQTGIGRNAVRFVETDGHGRMDACVLAAAMARDRQAGDVPIMIAATAGTTAAGMIDPLVECSRIAHTQECWFHVDAAWGGAMIASRTLSARLIGMNLADSVTIDAHKWFATSMGCGMFLIAEPGLLAGVFAAAMECMPSRDAGSDPYLNTVQWSRRFLGLRLFIVLASFGWVGLARHVEQSVALADRVRGLLAAKGWICANIADSAVLCMRPPEGGTTAANIVRTVVESGAAWVSMASFEGHDTVRICVCSGATTMHDTDLLVASLQAATV